MKQIELSNQPVHDIAQKLQLTYEQTKSTVDLLDYGATVPFIARYRKEATAGLDEVVILQIKDRLVKHRKLQDRKNTILASLEKSSVLTAEISESIHSADTLASLEDIYLPFRPKRRTRASMARTKGLEPLALKLWEQTTFDVNLSASAFIDKELGVSTLQDALSGARDITAEWISENSTARGQIRDLFWTHGSLSSNVMPKKESEASKFQIYFNWSEPVSTVTSHNVLAMLRGEKERLLSLQIAPPTSHAIEVLKNIFIKGSSMASKQVCLSVVDGYRRLIRPTMETEVREHIRIASELASIKIFGANLRELLLSPPLGQKNILAMDPGFRSGCKLVCLDHLGNLMHYDTVYPLSNKRERQEAAKKINQICSQFKIEAIALGNGTGGRETEFFLRESNLSPDIAIVMVNEDGASIYSASDIARVELPDLDITIRGAVSIGRRLMDPLSELVKIEPKSIGVGQYQHDVDQKALKEHLQDVVISCVNNVGVELNTASIELLSYVSGLNQRLAEAIVEHRNLHGPFTSRQALKQVLGIGTKTFEQAAGFLRIRDSEHPLDSTAVHPESYGVVKTIARATGYSLEQILVNPELLRRLDLRTYADDAVGLTTLNDIVDDFIRPGRDPRQIFETFSFARNITKIEDLEKGMKLPGIVTNVTAFGAFVDIGIHENGLVHISQISERFIKNPLTEVRVQQRVWVTVIDVDLERKRISLSLKR